MQVFGTRQQGKVPRSFRGGITWFLIPVVLLVLLLAAVWHEPRESSPAPASGQATVFVPTFERLSAVPGGEPQGNPPGTPGGHYELWVRGPGNGAERLAAFVVSDTGMMLSTSGEPVQEFFVRELPLDGSEILLTVEESLAEAGSPSNRILLRGTLKKTDVTFEPALPSLSGQGVALLLAPTDAKVPDTSGLWFAKPTSKKGAPGPGLQLPVLEEGSGWAYGGFVTTAAGTMLPTGPFTDPQKPDSRNAWSGRLSGLPFPGEDFVRDAPEGVRFPLNLADGRTTVAVGLLPNFASDASEPYVALLTARIPYRQKSGEPFSLEAVSADTLPRGRGTFEQRGTP